MQYIASATGAVTKVGITDMMQWRYAKVTMKLGNVRAGFKFLVRMESISTVQ